MIPIISGISLLLIGIMSTSVHVSSLHVSFAM